MQKTFIVRGKGGYLGGVSFCSSNEDSCIQVEYKSNRGKYFESSFANARNFFSVPYKSPTLPSALTVLQASAIALSTSDLDGLLAQLVRIASEKAKRRIFFTIR